MAKNNIVKLIDADLKKTAWLRLPSYKDLKRYYGRTWDPREWGKTYDDQSGLDRAATSVGRLSAGTGMAALAAFVAPKAVPALVPLAKKEITRQGLKTVAKPVAKRVAGTAVLGGAAGAGNEGLFGPTADEVGGARRAANIALGGVRGAYDTATNPVSLAFSGLGAIPNPAGKALSVGNLASAGLTFPLVSKAIYDATTAPLSHEIAEIIRNAPNNTVAADKLRQLGLSDHDARAHIEATQQNIRGYPEWVTGISSTSPQQQGSVPEQPATPTTPAQQPESAATQPTIPAISTQQFLETPAERQFQLDENIAKGVASINNGWSPAGRRAHEQLEQNPAAKAILDQAYQQLQAGETTLNLELSPLELQNVQAEVRKSLQNPDLESWWASDIKNMLQSVDAQVSQQLESAQEQFTSTIQEQNPVGFLQNYLLDPETHNTQLTYLDELKQRHRESIELSPEDPNYDAVLRESILSEDPEFDTKLESVFNSSVAYQALDSIEQGEDPAGFIQDLLNNQITNPIHVNQLKDNLADQLGTNPNTSSFLNYFMDWFSNADNIQLAAVGIGIPLALAGLFTTFFGEDAFFGVLMTVLGIASTAVGVTGAHNTLLPYFTQFFDKKEAV